MLRCLVGLTRCVVVLLLGLCLALCRSPRCATQGRTTRVRLQGVVLCDAGELGRRRGGGEEGNELASCQTCAGTFLYECGAGRGDEGPSRLWPVPGASEFLKAKRKVLPCEENRAGGRKGGEVEWQNSESTSPLRVYQALALVPSLFVRMPFWP